MTKPPRVSVKGKGADIFFGDFSGTQDPAPPPQADAAPPEEDEASKKANMQESTPARKQARKKAAAAASPQATAGDEATSLRALLASVWQPVAERATITNAFRYTDQDLSLLEDAIYDIHKKHKVRLTKQEVARLGLNAVLWDYQMHGDGSLLGEFIQKRKRQAEGET